MSMTKNGRPSDLDWLLRCAVNDVNWLGALERASTETIKTAMKKDTRATAQRKYKAELKRRGAEMK